MPPTRPTQDDEQGPPERDRPEGSQRKRPGRLPLEPPKGSRPLWWLLLLLGVVMLLFWGRTGGGRQTISYGRFRRELAADNIKRIVAEDESIRGEFREPIVLPPQDAEDTPSAGEGTTIREFETVLPPFGDEGLTDAIIARDVEFLSKGSGRNWTWVVLANALPLLLLVGFVIWIMRRGAKQAGGLMAVGRSRAKRFRKERTAVTFDDVAGAEEAKRELKEIIAFLKDPARFSALGGRVPKGVLLVGPPGTGKTLIARAVAGEADVPFFHITGSSFMEMFVGVGASRVRDLFEKAKRNAPCIIFVDELDSIGRHRGAGLGGGHDEREQTLNQLLSAMDGFEPTDNLIVLAATNRPDILDPALLRPGRFDRRVVVNLPSVKERQAILKVHTREVPLADDVDLEAIARSMPGRSGADLRNLVNEAALLAARREKDAVGADEFSVARDKILMGQPRGGLVLSGDEKHAVAIHEAGHAVTAFLTPGADPVEKVSIIPRARSLGATQQLPEERYNLTVEYLRARLSVMLGGRAAEEVLLGTRTTGAADDLAQATRLARRMVAYWGMSDTLRHVAFEETDTEVFLGQQIAQRRDYSEQTAREIDLEVKALIDDRFDSVKALVEKNRQAITALADALEDEETIENDALKEILKGRTTPPDGEASDHPQPEEAEPVHSRSEGQA